MSHGKTPALMSRRSVAKLAAFAAFAVQITNSQVRAEPCYQLEWKVPAERLDQARQATEFPRQQISADPSSIDATKGLPLLYLLAGIIALPDLAKGLVSVYKDWRYGSMIVDARDDKIVITHDPAGDADTIIVRGLGGKIEVINNRQSIDSSQWLKILTAATGKKK